LPYFYDSMELLKNLPEPGELIKKWQHDQTVYEVNGHLHSPYSFSPFESIEQMFTLAGQEEVKVLGINDFFTVDGYNKFEHFARENRIFPLFNIEFVGLMKEMQEQDVRINDPINPGRIYFCGKALRHPMGISHEDIEFLFNLELGSQRQVKEMIGKLNAHLNAMDAPFNLDYDLVKKQYARSLVRERHLARAIRETIAESYESRDELEVFYTRLFDGKKPIASLDDVAALENEIRSVILKKGGKAFVEENSETFPTIERIIEFIIDAGGVPCYPVLLDDSKGNLTGFEGDWDRMDDVLQSIGVSCIELIPSRNTLKKLEEFVDYFHSKNYIISFGTEHNTPELLPITVPVEKDRQLTPHLKQVSWEGVCALAAHQYLVIRETVGLTKKNGNIDKDNLRYYTDLGNSVIKEFISSD
jgi:hypothetical protein